MGTGSSPVTCGEAPLDPGGPLGLIENLVAKVQHTGTFHRADQPQSGSVGRSIEELLSTAEQDRIA